MAAIGSTLILTMAISVSRAGEPTGKPVNGRPPAKRNSEAADGVDQSASKDQPEAELHEQQPGRDEKKAEELVDVAAETASHQELAPLAVEFQRLSSLRMAADGNLLACDETAKQVKVIGPTGEVVNVIELEFEPEAIDVAPDGTIYVGGQSRLAKLYPCGKEILSINVPETAGSEVTDVSRKRAKKCDVTLRLRISGIAVGETDVFVAFGSGWSTVAKSKLFRFDRELQDPKLLAEGLRGCCQRCDIATDGQVVYVGENSVHRVVRYDREGQVLGKWGARSRTELEGFGACCNPMNLCLDNSGVLYTSESGLARVKRYTTDGECLGLVGYVGTQRFRRAGPQAASCSNIAVAATPDGRRVYVMDYTANAIRVLQRKPTAQ